MKARFLIPWLIAAGALVSAAQTTQPAFSKTVVPVLRKAGCPACHNHDGVASGTRVLFPEADASDAELDRFGLSLQAVVDRSAPEKSLLLLKPTKRIPHAGGLRIKPGSPEESVVSSWVAYLAKIPPVRQQARAEGPVQKQKPVLRRLTHSQYNNTIRDLLGNDSRLADQFPPEDFVNGFKNQFQSQSISPLLAESYSIAAEKLARYAFLGGDTHKLIPCKPAGAGRPSLHGVFHQRIRSESVSPSALDARSGTILEALHEASNRVAEFHRRRATRHRGDAAIAELPSPDRRTAQNRNGGPMKPQAGFLISCGTPCRMRLSFAPRHREN